MKLRVPINEFAKISYRLLATSVVSENFGRGERGPMTLADYWSILLSTIFRTADFPHRRFSAPPLFRTADVPDTIPSTFVSDREPHTLSSPARLVVFSFLPAMCAAEAHLSLFKCVDRYGGGVVKFYVRDACQARA